jgi:hypothetical protein
MQRDNEVDRFYLLTVRQLKAAIEDSYLSEKIGIKRPRECLGYRLVTKSMERIGDHLVRITHNTVELDGPVPEDNFIFGMADDASRIFTSSMRSLEMVDVRKANETIKMAQQISQNNLHKDVKPQIASISESLRRIAEYSADIAEIAINMSTRELHS